MKILTKIKRGVTLKQIKPQIYLLSFENNYEMCMTFLRYQESYESPSSRFRGKCFTILDFMEWYSKEFGRGAFTYPKDWGGFNLPGRIINKLHKIGIKDYNHYDALMHKVYNECSKYDTKFYLIGVSGDGEAFSHEMAHGFFFTNTKYKKEMTQLVNNLPIKTRDALCDVLLNMGYSHTVHVDELQAFLSTGLDRRMQKIRIGNLRKPFIKLFNSYYDEGNYVKR